MSPCLGHQRPQARSLAQGFVDLEKQVNALRERSTLRCRIVAEVEIDIGILAAQLGEFISRTEERLLPADRAFLHALNLQFLKLGLKAGGAR